MTTQLSETSDTIGGLHVRRELEPFENLDRLATVEMRTQGIPKGIVRHLYAAARGEEPLTHVVAKALLGCTGKRIAIFTGIVCEPLPKGEVDGTIGAAVLAKALESLDTEVDVVVPIEMEDVVEGVRRALDADFAIRTAAREGSEYAALVAIEKLGRNRVGTTHTILGSPVQQDFEADNLIEAFNGEQKLTIAIGDGGNEIGFGTIHEAALALVPRGRDCGCPCGGGILCATSTQLLFPAAVSNFGAYAVVAALAILAERAELAPAPDAIGSAIDAAVRRGCLDGGTFLPHVLADDGIPLEGVKAVVGVMRTIAEQTFRTSPRTT
jgi:hypothetical protein